LQRCVPTRGRLPGLAESGSLRLDHRYRGAGGHTAGVGQTVETGRPHGGPRRSPMVGAGFADCGQTTGRHGNNHQDDLCMVCAHGARV